MSIRAGQIAEAAGEKWLREKGYRILARNWRTRWSEIDIVAQQKTTIHLVEVKYRRRDDFGSGFDYITKDKADRLRRAAAAWMSEFARPEQDYQIDVLVVSGDELKIDFLPNAVTDKE